MEHELLLYYSNTCGFCHRVLDFMQERNIEIPMRETGQDPAAREELREIGGKTQVPCLLVDGQPMYESLDIIEWLGKNC